MSGRLEMPAPPISTNPADYGWNVFEPIEKPEADFGTILDGLKDTANANKPDLFESFTGSSRMDKALKKAVWDICESGTDSVKDYYDSLDDDGQEEFMSSVKKLIDEIDKELTGQSESGTVQKIFNALFGADYSEATDENTDEILMDILLKIKELKGEASSNEVLAALLPLMAELQQDSNETAEGAYSVEEMLGSVAFRDGGAEYRVSLQEMRNQLQAALDSMSAAEIIPDEEIPVIPEEIIPPVTEEIPEITPPENTEPEIPVDEIPTEPELPAEEIPEIEITEPEVIPEENTENAEASLNTIILNNRLVKKEKELNELRAGYAAGITMNAAAPYERIQNGVDMVAVQNQILENLTATLTASQVRNSEFRMLLNPGSLGEIAVKIVNNAGEISVSIAAQSESTQRLLESRLSALVTGLQNVNENVKDVRIVEAGDSAAFAGFNLNSFTEGRNGGNTSNRSKAPQIKIVGSLNAVSEAKETESEIYKGGNRLWQTV